MKKYLENLFDNGKYLEIKNNVDCGKENVIAVLGKIDERKAIVIVQDHTYMGGSIGLNEAKTICSAMDKAIELKVPLVSFIYSGGVRIEEGIKALDKCAEILYRNVSMSGVVPQISVIVGFCVGVASYSAALNDFIIFSRRNGNMFITGPKVVKNAIGEVCTMSELGGVDVHCKKSGVAHLLCDDIYECIKEVKLLLSYLPQNNKDKVRKNKKWENAENKLENIQISNQRKAYDMHQIIKGIIDKESFLELQPFYAENIIIGFGRIEGEVRGIVANNPSHLCGAIDIKASEKAARFIRFCDCFRIPILTIVDTPAFFPGKSQEYNGIIRHGAKLVFAYSEASISKVTLIVRKAYGGAYIAMNSKGLGADIVYAWPTNQIGVMGKESANKILKEKKFTNEGNSETTEVKQSLKETEGNKLIDEIISPENTRNKLSLAFSMLSKKEKIISKHSNMPI